MDRDQLMITPIITNLLSTNDRTIVNSSNHSHSPITCTYFLKVILEKKKLHQRNRKTTKISTIKYIYINIYRNLSQSINNNFPGHVFSREETLSCQTMFPRSQPHNNQRDITANLINALRYTRRESFRDCNFRAGLLLQSK